jgi:hypothetical protein
MIFPVAQHKGPHREALTPSYAVAVSSCSSKPGPSASKDRPHRAKTTKEGRRGRDHFYHSLGRSTYPEEKSVRTSGSSLIGQRLLARLENSKCDTATQSWRVSIVASRTSLGYPGPSFLLALDSASHASYVRQYIFPSRFGEGQAIVLKEAQDAAVPCLISASVPSSAIIVSALAELIPSDADLDVRGRPLTASARRTNSR